LAHCHNVVARRSFDVCVCREAVLGLRDADRQMSKTLVLQRPEAVPDRLVGPDIASAIEALRDRAHRVPQRHFVGIKEPELGLSAFCESDHGARKIGGAFAAARTMIGYDRLDTLAGAELLQLSELAIGVGAE